MSKPLATKVSTPLSENVQIRPKVSIFSIFPSTALTLLGMEFTRASQVATGVLFHSSMMTSRSWWMLMMFYLLFGDAPQIIFTLSFFNKAVVVLEVCLGLLSCWNTALRPSLQREGIVLCFSTSQYMSGIMVPSMNCSSPVPAALIKPQPMTLPPPCLTMLHTCLCTPHLVAATHAWYHLNRISLSWSHQTTGHGSSNPCP